MPKDMKLSPGDLSDLIAYYAASDQHLGPDDGVSEGFLAEMLGQQLGLDRFQIRGLVYSAIDRGRELTNRWHAGFRERSSPSTVSSPPADTGAPPPSSPPTPAGSP